MMDRGWRRSGTFCYKPNLRLSCCPQYTIRLDALEFKPSKSQRKLINRWNRFTLHGEAEWNTMDEQPKSLNGGKSAAKSFSLSSSIHAAESDFVTEAKPSHEFKVTLEPSTFTLEKYNLYNNYQNLIHHDNKNSPSGFRRFLVNSPLRGDPIPYHCTPPKHLPSNYGSYHQMYRLNGQLIAMAVLDILPNCVSSVYFIYDKAWERFSFGKLSALRETSLVCEMHEAGAPGMDFLYLGFYIHSCQKMKYKGEYSPSYLADPETYTWHPLKTCVPLLENYRYACFTSPDHSLEGAPNHEEDVLNDNVEVPSEIINQIYIIKSSRQQDSGGWHGLSCCIHGLGFELSKEVIFEL